MNPNFKKLALAASISAGLGATTLPVHAVMMGDAGEALLIPYVVHGGDVAGATNTYINVTVPGTVGFDTIPNIFTAPHTTPTNPGPTLFPDAASLQGGNSIHWYWFDNRSVHRLNGEIPVTADDLVSIDWLEASNGAFAGQDGYMVIGTEAARTRAAADFAMYGEAYIELYSNDPIGTLVSIPVLAMSDGADGSTTSMPSRADNVKYTSSGIPREVSPLLSGMRTNRSDGILDDTTVFNLSLGDRNFPSVHVVWLDTNLGSRGRGLNVDVYDSEELTCSDSADLPYELNVIEVNNWAGVGTGTPGGVKVDYCLPAGSTFTGLVEHPGFVTYFLPEYIDTGINQPESAGIAFSITMDWDANDQLRFTSSDVQVRGTYK